MSKYKTSCLYLLIFLMLSAIVYHTSKTVQSKTWKNKGMLETVILPDEEILKRVCLGYTNLGADLIWIRTIRYVFVHTKGDRLYPELPRFFKIITFLDPYFEDMYVFGGESSRELAKDVDFSITLLEKGRKKFPDNWKIAYELGKSYVVKKDWKRATRAFEGSLKMPDAPEWLAIHIAEGYFRQGDYKKSLYWWYQISTTANEREVRNKARSKVIYLVALNGASEIADACSLYYKKFSRLPDNPEQLLESGFLIYIPDEPFDGKYIIDKENYTVDSSHIRSLLSNCLVELNSRVEKYYMKFGSYPETIKDLKSDPEIGKDFPDHPYGGEYIIDHETHKVLSTKDYLAKIVIE